MQFLAEKDSAQKKTEGQEEPAVYSTLEPSETSMIIHWGALVNCYCTTPELKEVFGCMLAHIHREQNSDYQENLHMQCPQPQYIRQ